VEQRALVWRIATLVAAVAVLGGAALVTARPTPTASTIVDPPGVRIRVQVLNATPTRGLARRATGYLRDRGFDVVDVATAPQGRDSTLVIDRSGHPEWAQLVARALGVAAVEARLDSSRYLDVTVLVGRDWTPPAEPFYP
jgi:LytR cell envelope-related transcriptional attenuator